MGAEQETESASRDAWLSREDAIGPIMKICVLKSVGALRVSAELCVKLLPLGDAMPRLVLSDVIPDIKDMAAPV